MGNKTKLEECARVLCKAAGKNPDYVWTDGKPGWTMYVDSARAVIRCLMEQPDGKLSDAMTAAAFRASCKENGGIEMAIFPMFRNMLQCVLDEGK